MVNIVEEQLKEITDLHEKNKELYKRIGMLQESIVNAEKQRDFAMERFDRLLKEYEQSKENQFYEVKKQNSEIRRLEKEIAVHVENEHKLNELVCSMEKSISWKLTKPLRYLRWKQMKNGR